MGYVLNGYVWDMCGVICVGYVWCEICVGYVWCDGYVWDMCGVRYVWDMCGVRYANNLLKNPATKRLSGKRQTLLRSSEVHSEGSTAVFFSKEKTIICKGI